MKCIYCQSEAPENSAFCSKTCKATWNAERRHEMHLLGIDLGQHPELAPDPENDLEWRHHVYLRDTVEHPDGCVELLDDESFKPGADRTWTSWYKSVARDLFCPGGDKVAAENEINRVLELVPAERRAAREAAMKHEFDGLRVRIQQGEVLGPPVLTEAMLDAILVAWHLNKLDSLHEDAAKMLKSLREWAQRVYPRYSEEQRDKEVQGILLELKRKAIA